MRWLGSGLEGEKRSVMEKGVCGVDGGCQDLPGWVVPCPGSCILRKGDGT